MLIFAISSFFNAISAFSLGTYIFLEHRKERVYQIFYISVLSFTVWSFGYGMWQITNDKDIALLWCRIFSIGSTLIPITMLHWTTILLEKEKQQKKIIILGYILSALFLIFNFSPFFVKNVEPIFEFTWWPKPGILYTIYVLFGYLGLLFYSYYLLQKNYKNSTGIKKERIKYAKIAYILPIIGGATNFFYWYDIPIPPLW